MTTENISKEEKKAVPERRSRSMVSKFMEYFIERLIQGSGIAAIIFVLLIFVFLFRETLPFVVEQDLGELVREERWLPTSEPARYGLLPLILGSFYVTLGALVISVPLGLACALFISEAAPRAVREILKPAVELLAAVPSVVFGFLGLVMIGPWMADILGLPVGQFALLGSFLLAFMAMPTIVSVSEDALQAVPRSYRENSLALGATLWQTMTRVTFPAARSGIIAACLLGLGRAIGETMTVLMVTGNAAVIPKGFEAFLKPVRTMTATIAAEMGETPYQSQHYHSLFTIGLILFVITFAVNIIADVVVRKAGGIQR